MTAFLGWLAGFGLTLAAEGPIYLLGFAALGWSGGLRWRRAVLAVLVVNLVTHPVLWVTSRRWTSVADLLLGEAVVVLVEGLLLTVVLRRSRRELGWVLLLALAANATSVLVGLLVLP